MSLDLKTLKAKFINGKSYDLETIIKDSYKDLQLRTIKGHNASIQESCIDYLKEAFVNVLNAQPLSDDDFETKHKKIKNDLTNCCGAGIIGVCTSFV